MSFVILLSRFWWQTSGNTVYGSWRFAAFNYWTQASVTVNTARQWQLTVTTFFAKSFFSKQICWCTGFVESHIFYRNLLHTWNKIMHAYLHYRSRYSWTWQNHIWTELNKPLHGLRHVWWRFWWKFENHRSMRHLRKTSAWYDINQRKMKANQVQRKWLPSDRYRVLFALRKKALVQKIHLEVRKFLLRAKI